MNVRPIMHGMVNCTEECKCGNKKSIYKQWCEACWDKVPFRVARNMTVRAQALARQIETCEKHIKEATREEERLLSVASRGDSSNAQATR